MSIVGLYEAKHHRLNSRMAVMLNETLFSDWWITRYYDLISLDNNENFNEIKPDKFLLPEEYFIDRTKGV